MIIPLGICVIFCCYVSTYTDQKGWVVYCMCLCISLQGRNLTTYLSPETFVFIYVCIQCNITTADSLASTSMHMHAGG